MKKFWEDYVHLCKVTNNFYKKHWFGVMVINVIPLCGLIAWFNKDNIMYALEDKIEELKGKES